MISVHYMVYLPITKKSLDCGRQNLFKDCILKLAPINEYNTLHLLKTLGT